MLAAGRGPVGAARQEDSLLELQMQLGSLQYPRNPMRSTSTSSRPLRVVSIRAPLARRNLQLLSALKQPIACRLSIRLGRCSPIFAICHLLRWSLCVSLRSIC